MPFISPMSGWAYWHLWKDSECTESKLKSTRMSVHKGYSWYACSSLGPADLYINNRALTATQSLANSYVAPLKPQASLLLVPKTANLELIISYWAIVTVWLKEIIHQTMLGMSHKSSLDYLKYHLLLSQTPAPPHSSELWCLGTMEAKVSPTLSPYISLGLKFLFAVVCFMVQWWERKEREKKQQTQCCILWL